MNYSILRMGGIARQTTVLLLSLSLFAQPLSAAFNEQWEEPEEKTEKEQAKEAREIQRPVSSLEGAIDPEQYILGPYDELLLVLRGAENETLQLRILPEGTVILPNIGPFRAAGLTLSDFKEKLHRSLARFYKNIEIDCQLSLPRAFIIYVLGEVRKPGPVELFAPFRASIALERTGGVTEIGSLRKIEIREDGELVRRVDLFSFLRMGASEENPTIKEGQTLYVPPKESRAQLIGEVVNPGLYEVLPGETLADLIAFSGGFTTTSDKDRMVFERFEEEDKITTRILSFEDCKDITVQDRDKLVIPDFMSYSGAPSVQVFGGGGRAGIFYIAPGEKLMDFINRLGRFRAGYDLTSVVLERSAASGGKQYIHLNFEQMLWGDASGDLTLMDDDIITIPAIEARVYVIGEVKEPGEVPFFPGFQVERYVSLAGGPTEAGSIGKISIFSVDGKKRRGGRNNLVFRGETILVGKSTSKILGSAFLGLASITGLLISIVAISR